MMPTFNAGVTEAAVRQQVMRILSSDGFARARRMQRFLEYVVNETLAGRADQVSEYSIGVEVFDRDDDFEPGLDPIVRNDARRLRTKLIEYYRELKPGRAQEILIEIPKGGYVPVFRAGHAGQSVRTEQRNRLAVLPIEVLCGPPESAAFGRALGLSMASALTQVRGIETVAEGLRDQPLWKLARELRLTHFLEGTLLQCEDQLRVMLRVIHVEDGTQLWAWEHDFSAHALFSAQREVAASVRRELMNLLDIHPASPAHLPVAA